MNLLLYRNWNIIIIITPVVSKIRNRTRNIFEQHANPYDNTVIVNKLNVAIIRCSYVHVLQIMYMI